MRCLQIGAMHIISHSNISTKLMIKYIWYLIYRELTLLICYDLTLKTVLISKIRFAKFLRQKYWIIIVILKKIYWFFYRPSDFFRPPKIPKFLLNDFTHDGKIKLDELYMDSTRGKRVIYLTETMTYITPRFKRSQIIIE